MTMTEEFIDICIKRKVKASNYLGHISIVGWAYIILKFNEKFGKKYDYR